MAKGGNLNAMLPWQKNMGDNGLCAHCDFFASMSRDKELALRAVSTSYIFHLQQFIWKSFSVK